MSAFAPAPDELRELYRELILDHAKSPRHFGALDAATHEAEGINPLCGDKLKVYFRVDGDGRIEDAAFQGSGCAISVASASLLTDTVIGLTTDEADNWFAAVVSLLGGRDGRDSRGNGAAIELGKLRALEGVREFPSRVKCATLAYHALNASIHGATEPATTE